MTQNVGKTDKAIRLLVAVLMVSLYFAGVLADYNYILLIVAGLMVLTSVVSFCPLYLVFRINTCPRKA